MGTIKKHKKVKLVFGLISKDTSLFTAIENLLTKKFGKIDFKSQVLDFTHTDYYRKEFGAGLKRKFITFERLFDSNALPMIKILSNMMENKFSLNKKRRINIDPGYLAEAKLVLASTKDFTHRLYLEKGIFAEITLYFQNKTFNYWPWTFPDYRTEDYIKIFNHIRELYLNQIKNEN